jgi:hypothetical protein
MLSRLRGRGLLLLPVGALVVHQLRYMLAYGSSASSELTDQGHSYLHSLTPWIILSVGLAAGFFLCELALFSRTGPDREGRFAISSRWLWACTTVFLVGIYAGQEFLEGVFAPGHPAGFVGIFGHGGWWAIPVAALVAAGIVALQRIARAIIAAIAKPPGRVILRCRSSFIREPVTTVPRRLSPLACAAAGRAPPGLGQSLL